MNTARNEGDHIYKVVEIVGSSERRSDEAIRNAIRAAATSVAHIGWYEVIAQRGHIRDGEIAQFQVTLKLGFGLEK